MGNKTIDPQVKANLLSQFFQSQFTTDNHQLPSIVSHTSNPSISNISFSPTLVTRIINKLNSRSAGGPDGIPPAFFKNTCSAVSHPLAFIFQLLFEDGFLPQIWRKAFITAIFKKGDSTLSSNYRPISLTCTACKIMEAIIKDQLVSHLLSKGLISRQQHAFIKKHSTVTNLLQCTHDWAVSVHGGHAVDAVYIDFARAFDSVVHSKLIFKLSNFGISGKLLNWIAAFLNYRLQCVVVEHCNSNWLPVISGIPQGTVIGPVLFILFIDDVGVICSGSLNHKLFADDMKLYSTIQTNLDNVSLQSALDRLHKWCCDWQLNVNVSKCHILHFGKTNNHHSYFFNNFLIPDSNVVSDLGVEIDSSLKYDAHINKIVGKAYSRVGVLFKGFASRQIPVLKKAYTTYVRPIMEYASNVWSPHLLKHINAIERVQKHFTKRIPSLSNLSYPERLAALDLEPLELRRLKSDLVMYYKCLHDLVALPFNEFFVTSTYTSHTRSGGNKLLRPLCSTNHFENNFFYRCLSCWNYLPPAVVNASSISCFKRFLSDVDLISFMRCKYF